MNVRYFVGGKVFLREREAAASLSRMVKADLIAASPKLVAPTKATATSLVTATFEKVQDKVKYQNKKVGIF